MPGDTTTGDPPALFPITPVPPPPRLPHHLVVATVLDAGTVYRIDCPAAGDPRAACAAWIECGCTEPDDPDDACPASPTGRHQYLMDELDAYAMPTAECYVATGPYLATAAGQLNLRGRPGRYPVWWDFDGTDADRLILDVLPGEVTEVARFQVKTTLRASDVFEVGDGPHAGTWVLAYWEDRRAGDAVLWRVR